MKNSIVLDPNREGFPLRGYADHEYLPWLRELLQIHDEDPDGNLLGNRTGTGTYGIFGARMVFDLNLGFPLLTTKKVHVKSIIHELLWFLMGSTNIKYLQEHGVKIWDEWADKDGELGPVYGSQWRSWPSFVYRPYQDDNMQEGREVSEHWEKGSIDQIKNLIDGLKKNPRGRRHIVTAWNPAEIDQMKLPPCHCLFQFFVDKDNNLSCQLYQRSCDSFLGVPFNIASYALLTIMVAQVCDMKPGHFVHTFGDFHLYADHVEQARLQLTREPRELPRMVINPEVKDIFGFKYEDFKLEGYDPHPKIEAKVSV